MYLRGVDLYYSLLGVVSEYHFIFLAEYEYAKEYEFQSQDPLSCCAGAAAVAGTWQLHDPRAPALCRCKSSTNNRSQRFHRHLHRL
jgi:hypothetical protein